MTPRPLVHPDALSSGFIVVEQSLKTLVALSEHIEVMILEYYNGTHFSIIPRPLIVEPVISLLQVLRGSDHEPALVTGLARARENLRRSFPTISPDSSKVDFLRSFTGRNVRLEFIGLTFVLAGVATMYADTRPPFDEATFAMEMYTACRVCLQMCDAYNQVNDITTWARFINLHLSSALLGNASETVYQVFNESVAELFVMGFHRLISSPPNVPLFVLETRKRIFAAAVARDKAAATLFGRPPRIDNRFCDMTLPSDLDDEEVLLEGAQLQKASQECDADGWKCTTGKNRGIRQSSLVRLRYQHALLHEKVLHLSLGNRPASFSTELHDAYQDYHRALANIPQQYRYHSSVWTESSPHLCVALLVIHLTYLYSGFLLERMLLECSQIPISCLLDTSANLLSSVLDFIQEQHRHPKLRERYTWMFLYYGLPGAGTLATELHQSSQTGVRLPTSKPISQIIRNLSVLLAYFERKKFPDRPDFHICVHISKVISAVLDDTLNKGLPSFKAGGDNQSHQEKSMRPGQAENHYSSFERDGNLHSNFDTIPDLPDSMTSQDFLNWFDELIWDYPVGDSDVGNRVHYR
ncbi:fungal specific transcription factor domain-containing protein [Aspergillus undulatus]|uniref:fungal specific transcription factor domain-containing protein n=1 Tax=Aspergillus undulatus TaxID=1810928 RepID=UPI003CCCC4CB